MSSMAFGSRIAVVGPAGSGKSTVAREIGRKFDLPVVELDAIYHQPGWTADPVDVFRAKVVEELRGLSGGWIVDSSYTVVHDLLLPQADTVIWLKLPFRVTYPRVVKRTLLDTFKNTELWNGNRLSFRRTFLSRRSMLLWPASEGRRVQERTMKAISCLPDGVQTVVIESQRELEAFLDGLRSNIG